MNNENTEIFIGRLGVKPELLYTSTQKAVCHLSVAVNRDNDEKPIWKKVVVWGKQAELCPLYLKKGAEVFVQGVKQLKEYTNKSGEIKTYDEINARIVGFPNL